VTEIYFVRHAESDFLVTDEQRRPLTPKGVSDLEKLVKLFRTYTIATIYSSPYTRAIQTVKPIAEVKGLMVIIKEDFKERISKSNWIDNTGDLTTFVEKMWEDHRKSIDGGESIIEVQERNIKELRNVIKENENRKVIIGTHGTALASIMNYYDEKFTYKDFMHFIGKMPYVIKMVMDGDVFISLEEIAI